MTDTYEDPPNASSPNERLDWMFVDLLTLTVGLLIMQVFILPALRSSQATGVPFPVGKFIRVELRAKPDESTAPLITLRPDEWGIYVKCNETNVVTHGDSVQDAGGNRSMNSPRYSNDGTLFFELLPREDETYTLGVSLRSLADERLLLDTSLRQLLRNGMEVRVFSGSSKKLAEDPDNPLWQWKPFTSDTGYHLQIRLSPELWENRGDL